MAEEGRRQGGMAAQGAAHRRAWAGVQPLAVKVVVLAAVLCLGVQQIGCVDAADAVDAADWCGRGQSSESLSIKGLRSAET